MKRAMRKTIFITVVAICIICAALILGMFFTQRNAIPSEDLTLSDYPQLFAKEAVIVIGENASQIEKESAEAIAANLGNMTGNKPEIINTKKIESFKYSYNLIIVGTPKSNKILEEVYNMADAIRATDEYPGEGRGVLEILNNPWNEEKAMLLVEGSNEWGVKAAASKLEQILGINETSVIAELEKGKDGYKIFLSTRQFVPSPGISPSTKANITNSSLERVHVIVQFYHIPNATERENLENGSVKLLTYVHNNAWFASISSDSPAKILQFSFMRWIGEILPEDKISPYIQDGKIGEWAINPDGTVNLIVEFFSDVSLDDAEQTIKSHNGMTNSRIRSINALVVAIPQDAIPELANEDGVQWIGQVSPPPIEEPNNILEVG